MTVFALSVKTDGVYFKKDRFSYVYDIPNFLGVLSCNASVNSTCAQPLHRAIFLRPLQDGCYLPLSTGNEYQHTI